MALAVFPGEMKGKDLSSWAQWLELLLLLGTGRDVQAPVPGAAVVCWLWPLTLVSLGELVPKQAPLLMPL